jgi:hypothetical protein
MLKIWSMLEDFSESQRSAFLRFVRGISCLPSEELLQKEPFGLITVDGGALQPLPHRAVACVRE